MSLNLKPINIMISFKIIEFMAIITITKIYQNDSDDRIITEFIYPIEKNICYFEISNLNRKFIGQIQSSSSCLNLNNITIEPMSKMHVVYSFVKKLSYLTINRLTNKYTLDIQIPGEKYDIYGDIDVVDCIIDINVKPSILIENNKQNGDNVRLYSNNLQGDQFELLMRTAKSNTAIAKNWLERNDKMRSNAYFASFMPIFPKRIHLKLKCYL